MTVKARDARADEGFAFDVDGCRGLDAYHHPFAYAAAEQTGQTTVATAR